MRGLVPIRRRWTEAEPSCSGARRSAPATHLKTCCRVSFRPLGLAASLEVDGIKRVRRSADGQLVEPSAESTVGTFARYWTERGRQLTVDQLRVTCIMLLALQVS